MKKFAALVRNYTLLMSVAPFFVAFCLSLKYANTDLYTFFLNTILSFSGIIAIHMFANLFDDYIDIKKQLNKGLEIHQIDFRSKRKAKMILNGSFSMKTVKYILMLLVFTAFLTGISFIITKGLLVLLFMILAIGLSAFYPISTKFGLGEIIVGFIFGPLLINSVYYVLTGNLHNNTALISVSVGFITTVLLITQSVMEYDFDKSDGKKTVPVMLASQKNGVFAILGIIIICYLIMLFLSYINKTFLFTLPVIFTLPISFRLIKSLNKFVKKEDDEYLPKIYLGIMENMKEIKENNFSFFMFRFYLARNLSVIFNLLLAIVCIFT